VRAAVTDVGAGERDDGGGSRLVLVVDDDDLVRRVVRAVLEVDDLEVVEATTGRRPCPWPPRPTRRWCCSTWPCRASTGWRCADAWTTGRSRWSCSPPGTPPTWSGSAEAGAVVFVTKPFASGELVDLVEALLAV